MCCSASSRPNRQRATATCAQCSTRSHPATSFTSSLAERMTYVSVASHRSMALDRVRNDAYADALRAVVTPSSVVLDLGAGTGVHGLMAARMGARRVYL